MSLPPTDFNDVNSRREPVDRVNVGDILTRAADANPDGIAIIDHESKFTYRAVEQAASRLARALLSEGLKHQEVVALITRNRAEVVIAYFACARTGLIFAPMNLGLTAGELAWCLNDCRAKVVLAESELSELIGEVKMHNLDDLKRIVWLGGEHDDFQRWVSDFSDEPVEVAVGDREVAQLLYTSGTTGNPKGVLSSHLAVTITTLSNALVHEIKGIEIAYVQLPLFHCAMINYIVLPVMLMRGTIVIAQGFDIGAMIRSFDLYRVSMVVMLPVMFDQLLSHPAAAARTFPGVRRAMYGMAQIAEEKLKPIHAMFPNADVVLGSGQTEFTPATCVQTPADQWSKASTWGTATSMTRIAIMDENGKLLSRGEAGEIVYRGPQVMNQYLNQAEATAQAFRYGWFHSGDVGFIDADGAVVFTDRLKDIIKTGGENVASIEVEKCLLSHPGVSEAAVVGIPHPRWAEAVTAFVTRRPGSSLDERDLLTHCERRLAKFKVPKKISVVGELPRTGTGKVQKHMLRKQFKDLYAGT